MDYLPNEIVLEVFQFLHPRFLLKEVSFVSKRFRMLGESEFLYRSHYLKNLFPKEDYAVLKEKKEKLEEHREKSWKEYVVYLWKNRVNWVIKEDPDNLDQTQLEKRFISVDSGICYGIVVLTDHKFKFTSKNKHSLTFRIHGFENADGSKWSDFKRYPAMVAVGFVPLGVEIGGRFLVGSSGKCDCYFSLIAEGRFNWGFGSENSGFGDYSLNDVELSLKKVQFGDEVRVTIEVERYLVKVTMGIEYKKSSKDGEKVVYDKQMMLTKNQNASKNGEDQLEDYVFVFGTVIPHPLKYEIITC